MYIGFTSKGRSVFARKQILKGEFICIYKGDLCTYSKFRRRCKKYEELDMGSYIIEFKFREKRWAIDGTKEDGSIGRLINHSKKKSNVKPMVGLKKGQPYVYFIAINNISKD